MDIKALFFDIDGTLVPFGDHNPPEEVITALAEIRKKGIKVFIASGRHPNWIDNLGALEVDGYVAATGSICTLADRKTIIYKHLIPQEDIRRVVEYSHSTDIPIVAAPLKDEIVINRENKATAYIRDLLHIPLMPIKPLDTIVNSEIVQLMFFASKEERNDDYLFSEVIKGCDVKIWSPYFCDVTPKGSGKSVGIDHILRHFNINIEQTISFGDAENDLDMLQHTAIGVALGNASDEVKKVADYVTTDVREHGVVNALKHFGLQ